MKLAKTVPVLSAKRLSSTEVFGVTYRIPSPRERSMNGKILIYGNDEILNRTRGLILEKAGYAVLASMNFEGAMLTLMTQQIDVLLLCQSLADEQRCGILETAHALQPEIRCAVLDSTE